MFKAARLKMHQKDFIQDLDASQSWPKVSIILVNTNELHHIKDSLASLYNQTYPNFEIVVVDNASTDGSQNFIKQEFPGTRLVENEHNLGYTGGNNKGINLTSGKYIAILNPDTRVQPDWLEHLVFALEENSDSGLATPKILLWDSPAHINTCGNNITFTGLTFCRGLDEPVSQYQNFKFVPAVSGAAFLIRREVIDDIGGFDENYFIYFEETDLSLRAALAGYKSIYVPDSVIYHKYVFKYRPNKAFLQERNRHYTFLKTFRWPTLFALLPSLIIGELVAWSYALIQGRDHLLQMLRAWVWIVAHWRQILTARHQTQRVRRVQDRVILKTFQHRLNFTRTVNPDLAIVLKWITAPFTYLASKFTMLIVWW